MSEFEEGQLRRKRREDAVEVKEEDIEDEGGFGEGSVEGEEAQVEEGQGGSSREVDSEKRFHFRPLEAAHKAASLGGKAHRMYILI